jgi:hypothetical protein
MCHSAGFGYPLWAVVKNLVKRYGPWRRISLCAMGHCAKPITIAQELDDSCEKLVVSFKGTVMVKSVCV